MDRSWTYSRRNTFEYLQGVESFIKYAEENRIKNGEEMIMCLCCHCKNLRKFCSSEQVKSHLIHRGFKEGYTRWIWHGESLPPNTKTSDNTIENEDSNNDNINAENDDNNVHNDWIDEMMRDFDDDLNKIPHVFDSIFVDAGKPLFSGCNKFTKLSAMLKLYNLKVKNGWSDKSFTGLLELLGDMLPYDNELPRLTYEAKKMLCPLGMEIERIHACPNGCVLYWKELKNLKVCLKCGASRYKIKRSNNGANNKKGSPAKMLWYFPVIPRFKCLFVNANDAKKLQWHAQGRKEDEKLRHPADSPHWRNINRMFPKFDCENRNLKLGLCTDGMNPHGNMSSRHSTWPVLLSIYNLPPWLCMKRKYIMLSLLMPGLNNQEMT